jgi:hypothetical protein
MIDLYLQYVATVFKIAVVRDNSKTVVERHMTL